MVLGWNVLLEAGRHASNIATFPMLQGLRDGCGVIQCAPQSGGGGAECGQCAVPLDQGWGSCVETCMHRLVSHIMLVCIEAPCNVPCNASLKFPASAKSLPGPFCPAWVPLPVVGAATPACRTESTSPPALGINGNAELATACLLSPAESSMSNAAPQVPRENIDLTKSRVGLDLVATPLWLYDTHSGCNVWGNRAALELFATDQQAFTVAQLPLLDSQPEQQQAWKDLNEKLHASVELGSQEMSMYVTSKQRVPGFLDFMRPGSPRALYKAVFRPVIATVDSGTMQNIALVQVNPRKIEAGCGIPARVTSHCNVRLQVVQQSFTDIEENHLRMVEICNNHPMFQFLFDDSGKLLAANKRAMYNMKEHLGSCENYNLQMYLSIGECDGSRWPDDMYQEAMRAIFKEDKPCHRFPQLRWSKRHPGKYRWVLYEMWPMTDPITQQRAVLVCEQNISQVKALEEQFKRTNERLEAQLEEALAQRDPVHKPAIDIDTPADKTLKLLDKIMRGQEVRAWTCANYASSNLNTHASRTSIHIFYRMLLCNSLPWLVVQVSARAAMELRDAILQAGDLRQPVNFNEQMMKNSQTMLDSEVSQSLIQLLSSKRPTKVEEEPTTFTSSDSGACEDMPHLRIKTQPVTQESVRQLIALSRNLPDEVLSVLAKVDDWQVCSPAVWLAWPGGCESTLQPAWHLCSDVVHILRFGCLQVQPPNITLVAARAQLVAN
ncbi:phosphodiesterase [Haematococcus lacustris]|uniref:Phosphodiesterase n=1 Tax=Haematococcus lacustris TaxID=44745 RepID=A0A699YRH4_HAELA|nr:phosphodiesterase [Haematococcus lacustris]